jgi:hypothetical protein
MKNSLAGISILLFIISLILWVLLTVFESALAGMSTGSERILIFLLLVLPAGAGAVLGVMSLIRKEGHAGLAVAGIVLNGLFALFHIAILSFAG